MKRERKEPDARREEFIRAASSLFDEKGYENTSVDDIVERMGVAKGLFYYYFKSKEDLLAILVDRMMAEVRNGMEGILAVEGLTVMERIENLCMISAGIKAKAWSLVDYFHKESNKHLHYEIERRGMAIIIPVMQKILEQGVEEGVFDTKYPRETAMSYLAMLSIIGHENADDMSPKALRRKAEIIQHLSERLLGAKAGTFDIYTRLLEQMVPDMDRKPPTGSPH